MRLFGKCMDSLGGPLECMESGFAATGVAGTGLINVSLEFKRPGDEDTQDDEFEIKYESIKSKQVRDYTHLGELLVMNDPKPH